MTNPDKTDTSPEHPGQYPDEGQKDFATQREGKGLSLEEVFTRTRISVKNLSAIERNDFAALPPPVYTKAFIKQYAAFIGADPQPVMERYETYLKVLEIPRSARKSENPEEAPQGRMSKKSFLAIMILLFITSGVLLLFFIQPEWYSFDQSQQNPAGKTEKMNPPPNPAPAVTESIRPVTPPAEATVVPVAAPPETSSTPAPEVQTRTLPLPAPPEKQTQVQTKPSLPPLPANTVNAATAPGSQKMIITARENTWIAIRIDQQPAQQVYLRPGDTATYIGAQFRLDIGNAGGIDISLQGKTLPALGLSGQVVHVTLP